MEAGRLYSEIVEDGLQCLTQIEQAIDTHNLTQVHKAAHGLKAISRNMGTEPFAQLAVKIAAIG
ncbi:MAG: Hpt domain-containing protein [Nitrospirales bacterium]|nr:Hpt domain-containing protein [Nitrospirales bacterium]